MKTYIPKIKDIEKKWYIIDAKDKVLGDIATKAAIKLRGKDKAIFCSHMDCGDFVIIINSEKIKLTGAKMDKKMYYRHSGYPGGLRQETAGKLIKRKPNKLVELAVRGMLPKNKLRAKFMQKLKIFPGEEHAHSAQSPETLEI